MTRLLFDASALAKRYVPEKGTSSVNRLFAMVPLRRMSCLMLGAGEVAAVLVRRHNEGKIANEAFARAYRELLHEVVRSSQFNTLSFSNDEIEAALPYLQKHGLNITDALLLRIALDLRAALRPTGDGLVLVASDQRLLRAAGAEGLETLNPETQPEADLDALLAAP